MSDIKRYEQPRAARDPEFAEVLESGYVVADVEAVPHHISSPRLAQPEEVSDFVNAVIEKAETPEC